MVEGWVDSFLFLELVLGSADIADRTARGDELGAALGGISAIPGPVGMVGAAGSQIIYDVSRAFELQEYEVDLVQREQ